MLTYRLDELGWLQFENLCQSLLKAELGMGLEAWGGSGDFGRDAYFGGRLRFPTRDKKHAGPFIFQAKFVSGANGPGANSDAALKKAVRAEAAQIAVRKQDARWKPPKHYVLLTNAPVGADLRRTLAELLKSQLGRCRLHFQAGRDIAASLDLHPRLRLSFPQLLGLADLQALLRSELIADIDNRTESLLRLANQEARRFVPTKAYRDALWTSPGFVDI